MRAHKGRSPGDISPLERGDSGKKILIPRRDAEDDSDEQNKERFDVGNGSDILSDDGSTSDCSVLSISELPEQKIILD